MSTCLISNYLYCILNSSHAIRIIYSTEVNLHNFIQTSTYMHTSTHVYPIFTKNYVTMVIHMMK